MLARALVAAEGRPPDVAVLGVESVPGVAQLVRYASRTMAARGWCPSREAARCVSVAALPAAERPRRRS